MINTETKKITIKDVVLSSTAFKFIKIAAIQKDLTISEVVAKLLEEEAGRTNSNKK